MLDGTWMIFFRSDEELTTEKLAAALRELEGAEVSEGTEVLGVRLGEHEFAVELDDSEHVRTDAARYVREFGPAHPARALIERCDRCFLVRYALATGREAARSLTAIENALSVLVERDGAFTYAYNPIAQQFF